MLSALGMLSRVRVGNGQFPKASNQNTPGHTNLVSLFGPVRACVFIFSSSSGIDPFLFVSYEHMNVYAQQHNNNRKRLFLLRRAVFAWIFTSWALLAVTPVYVFMVRGLEDAGFVQEELDEITRLQAALPSSCAQTSAASAAPPRPQPPPPTTTTTQGVEVKQHTV